MMSEYSGRRMVHFYWHSSHASSLCMSPVCRPSDETISSVFPGWTWWLSSWGNCLASAKLSTLTPSFRPGLSVGDRSCWAIALLSSFWKNLYKQPRIPFKQVFTDSWCLNRLSISKATSPPGGESKSVAQCLEQCLCLQLPRVPESLFHLSSKTRVFDFQKKIIFCDTILFLILDLVYVLLKRAQYGT